jgi:hypothetical protein
MFTMAIDLRGQTTTQGLLTAKAVRLAALLGALVLMSTAINGLVILADNNPSQRSSNPANCLEFTQRADRLACYDNLAGRPVRHPFKGANAPVLVHSF